MTYAIATILIALSGLFSGLTLGLMSMSAQELKRKMALGDTAAAKVYAVRKDGNLLLTTLLIGNVAVNSVLSVFLGSLTSGLVASVLATALIFTFGEIIPMASFSRHPLYLGSRLVWVVRIFIFIFYPISKPIALMLNRVLGEELMAVHTKQELIHIIQEHQRSHHSEVDETEGRIVSGALTFSEKKVSEVMTPRAAVYTVSADSVVSESFVEVLAETNFSRVPVLDTDHSTIIGVLYLKDLISHSTHDKTVRELMDTTAFVVKETDRLDHVFELFTRQHRHLFVVQNAKGETVGIITLEDILEEIIKTEIDDESDKL